MQRRVRFIVLPDRGHAAIVGVFGAFFFLGVIAYGIKITLRLGEPATGSAWIAVPVLGFLGLWLLRRAWRSVLRAAPLPRIEIDQDGMAIFHSDRPCVIGWSTITRLEPRANDSSGEGVSYYVDIYFYDQADKGDGAPSSPLVHSLALSSFVRPGHGADDAAMLADWLDRLRIRGAGGLDYRAEQAPSFVRVRVEAA